MIGETLLLIALLCKKRIYVAGPMTNIPDYNYPAFRDMHKRLTACGFVDILDPTTIAEGDTSKPYDFYIRESLKLLTKAEAMIMLDGWEKSKGACLEYQAARAMNLTILDQNFNIITDFTK